ncbi:hypothetical protein GYMLUDRAFT_707927, partial [Collybiopsis luxurians FD-317 M1]
RNGFLQPWYHRTLGYKDHEALLLVLCFKIACHFASIIALGTLKTLSSLRLPLLYQASPFFSDSNSSELCDPLRGNRISFKTCLLVHYLFAWIYLELLFIYLLSVKLPPAGIMYSSTFPLQASGNVIVGRRLPDLRSSPDEFSALTDVPLFLGYMLGYFLSGILFVQVYLYFSSFRRSDSRFLQITVLVIFLVECISTVIATVLVIWSIISQGYLSYSILEPGFQAVAVLCGIASSIVHVFYCWRIHVLGGHWAILVFVMTVSLVQCVMVSISGFAGFGDRDVLEVGPTSHSDSRTLCIIVLWLTGSAICDIVIATTILYLRNRIVKSLGKSDPLATRVEKLMRIAIDTGMITAFAATAQLLLFLILRDTLVQLCIFYALPKLYANCAMATLNARLAVPGQCFQEDSPGDRKISRSEDPNV